MKRRFFVVIFSGILSLNNVKFSSASASPLTTFPTSGSATYSVTDADGSNPLKLYQWSGSYSAAHALGGMAIPSGRVNIKGVIDVYNGTDVEFIPFSVTAVPEPALAGMMGIGALALRRRSRVI